MTKAGKRKTKLPTIFEKEYCSAFGEYARRGGEAALGLTSPNFCTSFIERVYITAIGCEIGLGGTRGLQAAGAGGL
jgi:hypothetical protein